MTPIIPRQIPTRVRAASTPIVRPHRLPTARKSVPRTTLTGPTTALSAVTAIRAAMASPITMRRRTMPAARNTIRPDRPTTAEGRAILTRKTRSSGRVTAFSARSAAAWRPRLSGLSRKLVGRTATSSDRMPAALSLLGWPMVRAGSLRRMLEHTKFTGRAHRLATISAPTARKS